MNFSILCDNPVGGRSSRIHNKHTQKDKKLPLKWRFSWVVDTAGHRLWTVSPEVRHFSVWIYLCCSVATSGASLRPQGGAPLNIILNIVVDDVHQKKETGNSVETNFASFRGKGWVQFNNLICKMYVFFIAVTADGTYVYVLCMYVGVLVIDVFRRSTVQNSSASKIRTDQFSSATLKSACYNIFSMTCFAVVSLPIFGAFMNLQLLFDRSRAITYFVFQLIW